MGSGGFDRDRVSEVSTTTATEEWKTFAEIVNVCMYVSLCIRWMVSQSSVCLSVCLCMCICVPLRVSVCMSESVSVHVPMCLSVYVCLLDGQSLPLSVCPCMSVCMCACVSVCVYVCQLEGQSVPLEVHLLKLVAHVDGVVKLLDYFDKPDSFVVVVDRKP